MAQEQEVGKRKQQSDRWEPLVLPIREGKAEGHPSYQENSGGWEAATSYLREKGDRQGLFLPIDNLNGNISARLSLRDTGHQRQP